MGGKQQNKGLADSIYARKSLFLLVPPGGFEPPTHRLGICCSILLSYEGIAVAKGARLSGPGWVGTEENGPGAQLAIATDRVSK